MCGTKKTGAVSTYEAEVSTDGLTGPGGLGGAAWEDSELIELSS